METRHTTLFLHGGFGWHCAVERVWFGDALPVLWWDQPSVAAEPEPYAALVRNAASGLRAMSASAGAPINLIAHSFGGQLAATLAAEHGELIRSITLLGCPPSPLTAFFHFARQRLNLSPERSELKAALTALEACRDMGSLMTLVQACYPDGALPDSYFGPDAEDVKTRYFDIASRSPGLDVATFMAVMQDFLHPRPPAPANSYAGEVKLLMGLHDPLLSVTEDGDKWLKVFPRAEIQTCQAGHFVQLELPPDIWCAEQ